jgi:hypothetical protein
MSRPVIALLFHAAPISLLFYSLSEKDCRIIWVHFAHHMQAMFPSQKLLQMSTSSQCIKYGNKSSRRVHKQDNVSLPTVSYVCVSPLSSGARVLYNRIVMYLVGSVQYT